MKSKLLYGLIVCAAIILTACGGEAEETVLENPNGIIIHGEVQGVADGTSAILWVFENQEDRIADSTTIVDGQFDLLTDTKELREYVLVIDNNNNEPVYFFPDENSSNITVKGSMPGFGTNYEVEGDQNSIDYKEYRTFILPYKSQQDVIFAQYDAVNPEDKEKRASLLGQMDSINNIKKEYAIDYIKENPSSPVAWVMLSEFYPPSGIAAFDTVDFEYFELVKTEMAAKYPYSEYVDFIDKSISNTKSQLALLAAGGGDPDAAPELVYNNPDGEPIALSSLRGKVVLIDFWASWCGPCRMENPNVVKTYNEYKDKGFTIYSVSLDQDLNKWKQAIEADNLSWPNHVSDLKGWQSEAAAKYKVNSIPATFLLDKDGKIIDQNLRGAQLEQKLQEILG
jgi:thiol-disulfide isomerase/thioredoxin